MSARTPSPWPPFLEDWVLPYVREPALRPVLLALLGHVVVVAVPLILAVVRRGDLVALALLALLALGSAAAAAVELRALRRPGGVLLTVVGTWAACAGAAWLADRTGAW